MTVVDAAEPIIHVHNFGMTAARTGFRLYDSKPLSEAGTTAFPLSGNTIWLSTSVMPALDVWAIHALAGHVVICRHLEDVKARHRTNDGVTFIGFGKLEFAVRKNARQFLQVCHLFFQSGNALFLASHSHSL